MNKTTEHKFAVGDRVIYKPQRTGNGWLAGEHGIEPKPWRGWFCKEENLEAEA